MPRKTDGDRILDLERLTTRLDQQMETADKAAEELYSLCEENKSLAAEIKEHSRDVLHKLELAVATFHRDIEDLKNWKNGLKTEADERKRRSGRSARTSPQPF
jgi:hypothetical protein